MAFAKTTAFTGRYQWCCGSFQRIGGSYARSRITARAEPFGLSCDRPPRIMRHPAGYGPGDNQASTPRGHRAVAQPPMPIASSDRRLVCNSTANHRISPASKSLSAADTNSPTESQARRFSSRFLPMAQAKSRLSSNSAQQTPK